MRDPAATAGPGTTSWRMVNIVLLLVALVLAATTVLFERADAGPGSSRAEAISEQYEEVTRAAREETLAFLTIDHRAMDPLIEKVLAGATGRFKESYDRSRGTLKASARKAQATSTGSVLHVGIGDLDESEAVVLVAADSQVRNRSTRGRTQPRYHRLELTMVRQGGKWLTSDLRFVG